MWILNCKRQWCLLTFERIIFSFPLLFEKVERERVLELELSRVCLSLRVMSEFSSPHFNLWVCPASNFLKDTCYCI